MNNLLKALIALMLTVSCLFVCASCDLIDNGGSDVNNGSENENDETNGFEDEENSYRIRFVYSYTAKVENASGRLENKQSIVTVKSFFVPKENNGVSDEMLDEMKALSYHGFTFVEWYSQWNIDTQTGVEGTEFSFTDAPITGDMTLYCDRGNLAGPDITWDLEYIYETLDETAEEGVEPELTDVILHIEGTGAMFDFDDATELDVPWYKSLADITKIVVSDGITSIGNNSFNGLSYVTEVVLPDTVERIGEFAFAGYAATKFVAPTALKTIERNAFYKTSLKEVVLNDGLENLGEKAFYGSNKIKTIVFPATITNINIATFHPGGVNNKNNSHSLSKVFYLGTQEQFEQINIAIDNTWFEDKATIYYYEETPENYGEAGAEEIIGNYWHYAGETETAVQYCYTIKYVMGSEKAYLCSIFIPATPVLDENGEVVYDEDGNPVLEGIITPDHIRQQSEISYHNYKFSGFSGANSIKAGDVITSDITYSCQRGKILSDDGGIVWSFANSTLNISLDPETEARITADVRGRIDIDGKIILSQVEKEILGVDEDVIVINEEQIAAIIAGRLERSLYMWDFAVAADASDLWTASTTKVIIGEGIKYIGKYALSGVSRTAEILIPASVGAINELAFDGCTDLTAVYYNGTATDAMKALSNKRYTVYSLIEEGTGEAGSYWMTIEKHGLQKRIAWTLTEDGVLTIGGDNKMIDFDKPEEAPWYDAKDKVTSVVFKDNITSIGQYAVNGYANAMSIYIPGGTRSIPSNSIAGTGLLNNNRAYDKGVLVINGHLIRVNPAVKNNELFETYTGIITIADGAFDGCTNLKTLYVARTMQYIDPGAFAECNVETIFADGDKDFWAIIDAKVDFDGASVYYKHTEEYITVTDETGKQVTVKTSSIENTYWFKCGNEYVIWGCPHVYGEFVSDNNATCTSNATETKTCSECGKTVTVEVPDTMLEHSYDETTHLCTSGCGETDPSYQESES